MKNSKTKLRLDVRKLFDKNSLDYLLLLTEDGTSNVIEEVTCTRELLPKKFYELLKKALRFNGANIVSFDLSAFSFLNLEQRVGSYEGVSY